MTGGSRSKSRPSRSTRDHGCFFAAAALRFAFGLVSPVTKMHQEHGIIGRFVRTNAV
jgi:hypothetical protein